MMKMKKKHEYNKERKKTLTWINFLYSQPVKSQTWVRSRSLILKQFNMKNKIENKLQSKNLPKYKSN